MTGEARIQMSREKGFRLQQASRELNGLPARVITRNTIFGNIFKAVGTKTADDAVLSFRKFLREWSDTKIMQGAKDEDGTPNPMTGVCLIVLRNRIRANLWTLQGHNLACFCKPGRPCHADVYLSLLKTEWPARWKAKYPALVLPERGGHDRF